MQKILMMSVVSQSGGIARKSRVVGTKSVVYVVDRSLPSIDSRTSQALQTRRIK